MPNIWKIRSGLTVLIGAPAKPMPDEQKQSIQAAIEQNANVSFAYAPQMYSKGYIDPPRQVLYVVLEETARGHIDEVMQSLGPELSSGQFIDMLPVFDDHPWLREVIRTRCVLAVNDSEHHARCVAGATAGNT